MTSLLLTQLPDPQSAQALGWIAVALVCLVGGINQVLKLTDRFREQPPAVQTYATKVEHRDLATKLDVELGRERSARKKIHEEIAELQSGVSAIRAETSGQTRDIGELKQQISETNTRIDAVPQRTISLLRETQQLHAQK
ncbi:MAG: hypothetical protein HZC55_26550 [Verrucomicrobia bacterium]|nr:hypothetical protein [Verrucomicrobiota bacterium]